MESGIASTVTASSVMLAAFAFSFNALKGRLEAAAELGEKAANPDSRKKQRAILNRGVRTAGALAVIALAVALILLKPAVNEVEAAFRVHFSLHDYSALDIIFVLLTATWFAIAVGLGYLATSLFNRRGGYGD